MGESEVIGDRVARWLGRRQVAWAMCGIVGLLYSAWSAGMKVVIGSARLVCGPPINRERVGGKRSGRWRHGGHRQSARAVCGMVPGNLARGSGVGITGICCGRRAWLRMPATRSPGQRMQGRTNGFDFKFRVDLRITAVIRFPIRLIERRGRSDY